MYSFLFISIQRYLGVEKIKDDTMKTSYILIAVSATEALLIVVIIYASVVTKNK